MKTKKTTSKCDNSCFNSSSCVYRVMYEELNEPVICPCTNCLIKMVCNNSCENYGINRKRLSTLKVQDHDEYSRILSIIRTEKNLENAYQYYISNL